MGGHLKLFSFVFLLMLTESGYCQSVKIFGTVREASSGETISGAIIINQIDKSNASSNSNGRFSISVAQGQTTKLSFSRVGYLPKSIEIHPTSDSLLTVELDIQELDEFVVTSAATEMETTTSFSIPVAKLTKIPTVLGEPDLFKSLALLPGVSTGIEGSSGLFVRGGTPDQNLILLDDVPIYNPNHLFGFFSVFHPEMVKSISLVKSGFPAKYGGRLSSVIDVRMKDGDKSEFKGEASLGLINSRISIEGPIGNKSSTSYHLGGRISYIGAFMKPIFKLVQSEEIISYVMHDWNGKLHHIINDKNELFLSYYFGRDNYEGKEGTKIDYETYGLNWGNQTLNLRYKKTISPSLFANFSAWTTEYKHEIKNQTSYTVDGSDLKMDFFSSKSGLRDFSAKAEFEWNPLPSHDISFGAQTDKHRYLPGSISSSFLEQTSPSYLYAFESALFAEDSFSPWRWMKFSAGLRATQFRIEDQSFSSLEPRLSTVIEIGESTDLRASYTKMRQYIHMLSSNGVGVPNDIWIPASEFSPPQTSHQWTLGIGKKLINSSVVLKMSLEGYYKHSTNLIEPVPGTNFMDIRESNWEGYIYNSGEGRARGLEFLLEAENKVFNGWISYTLSSAERKFTNLNSGDWYPSRYDRRHNFSFVGNFKLTKGWELNANWVYTSGNPVTLPVAVIQNTEGDFVPVYSTRNSNRMPAYHRLDFGAIRNWTNKKERERSISFGLYNVYNRVNPLYINYDIPLQSSFVGMQGIRIEKKGGIPILPYFNYSIKF